MFTFIDCLVVSAAVGLAVGYRIIGEQHGRGKQSRLLGRICLIGASSGIGRQLALQLASTEIYGMVLASRSLKKLEELCADCNQVARAIDKVSCCACDITKLQDLKRLLAFCGEKMGGVDTLIICSGVLSTMPFGEIASADDVEAITNSILQTNTVGPILATKVFLPSLEQSASIEGNSIKPRIVVVSSASGVMAAPTRTLYTASKHALTGFFRALRMEIRGSGVSVCHVMPGSVDTSLRESALDAKESLDLEARDRDEDRDEPIRSPPLASMNSTVLQPGNGGTTRPPQSKMRKAMSPEKCASIIIQAAQQLKEEVYIPKIYQIGVLLGVLFPGLIEYLAKKKYNYTK